jgi:hypothetical protein
MISRLMECIANQVLLFLLVNSQAIAQLQTILYTIVKEYNSLINATLQGNQLDASWTIMHLLQTMLFLCPNRTLPFVVIVLWMAMMAIVPIFLVPKNTVMQCQNLRLCWKRVSATLLTETISVLRETLVASNQAKNGMRPSMQCSK